MKKILLIAAAALSMTVGLQADTLTINCAQLSLGTGAAPVVAGDAGSLACPGFGVLIGSLGTINSITFVQTTDYNVAIDPFNPGVVTNTSINYTMTVPGTVYDAAVTNRNFVRTVTTNPLIQNSAAALYADYFANFNLGVTINSVTNASGIFVQQAIFDGAFRVDYTLPPPSGIPEPSTVALIGAGLVSLATAVRRSRS